MDLRSARQDLARQREELVSLASQRRVLQARHNDRIVATQGESEKDRAQRMVAAETTHQQVAQMAVEIALLKTGIRTMELAIRRMAAQ
jgi:hypothetical protein